MDSSDASNGLYVTNNVTKTEMMPSHLGKIMSCTHPLTKNNSSTNQSQINIKCFTIADAVNQLELVLAHLPFSVEQKIAWGYDDIRQGDQAHRVEHQPPTSLNYSSANN